MVRRADAHHAAMQVGGHAEPRFESVRETFVGIVETQSGTGAALAIWHGGRWVVDVWGGCLGLAPI
jgi:hypothetical protein